MIDYLSYRFTTSDLLCELSKYNLTENWGIKPTPKSSFIGYASTSINNSSYSTNLPTYVEEFSFENSSEVILRIGQRIDNFNVYEKTTYLFLNGNSSNGYLAQDLNDITEVNVNYTDEKLIVQNIISDIYQYVSFYLPLFNFLLEVDSEFYFK